MTFELTRIWIGIPIQVIRHLKISLNQENDALSYPQFVESVQSVYNLLHLITLFKVNVLHNLYSSFMYSVWFDCKEWSRMNTIYEEANSEACYDFSITKRCLIH